MNNGNSGVLFLEYYIRTFCSLALLEYYIKSELSALCHYSFCCLALFVLLHLDSLLGRTFI